MDGGGERERGTMFDKAQMFMCTGLEAMTEFEVRQLVNTLHRQALHLLYVHIPKCSLRICLCSYMCVYVCFVPVGKVRDPQETKQSQFGFEGQFPSITSLFWRGGSK